MFDSSFLGMPSALNLTPPTPTSSKSLAASIPPPPPAPPTTALTLASPMPMTMPMPAGDLYMAMAHSESGSSGVDCGMALTTGTGVGTGVGTGSGGGNKFPRCCGCEQQILDRYLLTLLPDQQWHCGCLRCVECGRELDESAGVCFVRGDRTFCKPDYTRLFLRACGKCGQELHAEDLVMRTRTRLFHSDCFRCAVCTRPLGPGERIAVRPLLTQTSSAASASARWPGERSASALGVGSGVGVEEALFCEAHAADAAAASTATAPVAMAMGACTNTTNTQLTATATATAGATAPSAQVGQPLTLVETPAAPSAVVAGCLPADYQPCLLSATSQRPSSICDDDQLIADTDDKDDLPEGVEDETSSNANDEKEALVYAGLTVSTRRLSTSAGDGDGVGEGDGEGDEEGDGESSGLSSPGSGSEHSPSSRHSSAGGALTTPNSHTAPANGGGGGGHGDRPSKRGRDGQKTTRVRTVLNEKQLQTLRTCYAANPRPDALMKEQLVEMTGLSPRVIRVWFQNKRCKDKKKSIILKQLQQQQEKSGLLGKSFAGVPMVAPSPVVQGELAMPVEIQAFHAAAAAAAAAAGMAPYSRAGTMHHTPGSPGLSSIGVNINVGLGIGGVQVPLWKTHGADGMGVGGNPGGVPPLLAPDASAYGGSPTGYQLSAYDEFIAAHNAALTDVLYAR